MERLKNLWKSLKKDTKGVALMEYALIAALIAVVSIFALTQLGNNVKNKMNNIAQTVS